MIASFVDVARFNETMLQQAVQEIVNRMTKKRKGSQLSPEGAPKPHTSLPYTPKSDRRTSLKSETSQGPESALPATSPSQGSTAVSPTNGKSAKSEPEPGIPLSEDDHFVSSV